MTERFAGRRILIAGAAGALGSAAARGFAREGGALFLADHDGAALCALADDLGLGADRRAVTDVTDEAAVAACVAAAEGALGGIDVLVNAAGICGPAGPMIACSVEDWGRLFAINVRGTFLMCKHAIPALRRAGGGAVVNYASSAGLAGDDSLGPYAATKGAVVLMTRSLARNHAPEGIRVNCVCPGSIALPMLETCFDREAAHGGERDAIRARYLAGHPIGRFGKPEEVAAAVLFLASDDAAFMAGVSLPVDGAALA
jgi:NAD(P)-dependent dehydrogenase (short-subunit alcohol dehydrogenase family)